MNNMSKSQSIVAIFICIVIIAGSIFFSKIFFKRYEQMKKYGIETEALITKIDKRRSGSTNNKVSYSYFLTYSFIDKNGGKIIGTEVISKSEVPMYRNTDKIKITYLPTNPKISQSSESLHNKNNVTIYLFVLYSIIGVFSLGLIVNIKTLFKKQQES